MKASYESMSLTSRVSSSKRKYLESVENQWQTWEALFLNNIEIGDTVNVLRSSEVMS